MHGKQPENGVHAFELPEDTADWMTADFEGVELVSDFVAVVSETGDKIAHAPGTVYSTKTSIDSDDKNTLLVAGSGARGAWELQPKHPDNKFK